MSMDSIYLMGSEDILKASHNMGSAADRVQRAADLISESIDRIERDLIIRLEDILRYDRRERERIFNEHG